MLDAITLSNFKSFANRTIALRPITMLSGVNGSGKSTILQAIAVVKQSYDANCLVEGLLLNGELVELGTGKDVLFEGAATQEVAIALRSGDKSARWKFRYGERDDLLEAIESPSREEVAGCDLFSGAMQFLRADRISPAAVYPRSYAQAVRRRFLGVHGQFAVHFLAFHQDEVVSEARRRAGKEASARLLDQVSAWLSEVSPGVAVESRELTGTDLAQLSFTFGGKAGLTGSNEYRPTNVGFGLTYCLPIIVGCLSAAPGDILLIENPEAHLHPRGQAVLTELLCQTSRDGVQVIFETHSDHVLNCVRLQVKRGLLDPSSVAIHYARLVSASEGTDLISPELTSDGRLSSWPPGFFDEWERALLELV